MPKQPVYGAPNEPNTNRVYGYELGKRDCERAHRGEYVRFMEWISNETNYYNGYVQALRDGGCELQFSGIEWYIHVAGMPLVTPVATPSGSVGEPPVGPLAAQYVQTTPVTRTLPTPSPFFYSSPWWRR